VIMNFKEATDRLMDAGIALPDIAAALGAAYTTARAWRLDPDSPSFRRPPEGWEVALARLARERAQELSGIAEELEGRG
jgi:hypothetical protein